MIHVTGISTQARKAGDSIKYRFRTPSDIYQAVREASQSRHGKQPIYTDCRGIPEEHPSPGKIADHMEAIQQLHNKTSGMRIREEMVSISDDELDPMNGRSQIKSISDRLSDFFYDQGFQCAYGVYPYNEQRGTGYDILYTINTVSFRDGRKYKHNSNDYISLLQNAAETVIGSVTGRPLPETDRFDFDALEYAD